MESKQELDASLAQTLHHPTRWKILLDPAAVQMISFLVAEQNTLL